MWVIYVRPKEEGKGKKMSSSEKRQIAKRIALHWKTDTDQQKTDDKL